MLKRIAMFLGAAMMVMVLVAACGGGGDSTSSSSSSGGGSTLTIVATDNKFDTATLNAKVGEKVTVKLQNKGAVVHDFTIDDIGGKKIQTRSDPGKTTEVSFTPDKAGSFKFYCAEPGHEALGMKGTFEVK